MFDHFELVKYNNVVFVSGIFQKENLNIWESARAKYLIPKIQCCHWI